MAYSHITYAQFRAQLAARLGDAGNVFWTDAELGRWSLEALRTWQALTSYTRDRMVFDLAAGTTWYDLPDQAGSLRPYTLTDQDLVRDAQYALLEPATGSSWTGSDMFTLDAVQGALQRRRDQLLAATGCVITRTTVALPAPPIGRVPLADSTIDVRRVAYVNAAGTGTTPLFRDDEQALTSFQPGWALARTTPQAYSVLAPPPLTLQLAPPPANTGTLDVLTVNAGAALDATTGVLLGVPDDAAWVIKWGALADLLGMDGQARDPQRAEYCEARWRHGCEVVRAQAAVVHAQLDGVDVLPQAASDLDTFSPAWQSAAAGDPAVVALAGLNLLAVAPAPNTALHNLTLDVVRNAPVPTADTDKLQAGREELDALLDYGEHVAAFKMGGAEWQATLPLLDRFLAQAVLYNERLRAMAHFVEPALGQSRRESQVHPRRTSDARMRRA